MARLIKDPVPGFERRQDEDWEAHFERQDELVKEIERTRTVWRTPVADGYALYLVVKESPLTLQHIPYGDGYRAAGATIRGLTLADVEHQRKHDAIFQGMHDEAEAFYASLKPGQTVHYHHGFNEWIRCEVVVREGRNELLPKALVGEWREYDLPRREPDGSVRWGYQAKKIAEGRTMRPHATSLWENPKCANRDRLKDPAGLAEVDLSVPDMSPGEAERAALWRKVAEVRALVAREHRDLDPAEILRAVRAAVAA